VLWLYGAAAVQHHTHVWQNEVAANYSWPSVQNGMINGTSTKESPCGVVYNYLRFTLYYDCAPNVLVPKFTVQPRLECSSSTRQGGSLITRLHLGLGVVTNCGGPVGRVETGVRCGRSITLTLAQWGLQPTSLCTTRAGFESVQIGPLVTVTFFGALFRLTIGRETTCTHTHTLINTARLAVSQSGTRVVLL
jgi:hypothetical protein